MGKKMKLPFLSQSKSLHCTSTPQQWPFPSCGNIKTLSFREDAFTTFNSAYIDTEMTNASNQSLFTVSSSSQSFSTMSNELADPVESLIRGLRSERLFFEPEQSCSLILREEEEEEAAEQHHQPQASSSNESEDKVVYQESELMPMESKNPCEDFRRSMEEMVEAHGLKEWEALEELLGCYLKINGKNNHGYIMGAFIDLLVSLSFSTTPTSTNTITTPTTSSSSSILSSNNMNSSSSPCSPLSLPSSSITTSCLSSLLDHDGHSADNDEEHDDR